MNDSEIKAIISEVVYRVVNNPTITDEEIQTEIDFIIAVAAETIKSLLDRSLLKVEK